MESDATDKKSNELIISDIDMKKLRLCAAHPEMFRGNPGGAVMLSTKVFIEIVETIEHLMAQNTALKKKFAKSKEEYATLKMKKDRKKVDSDFRFRLKELRLSRGWNRHYLAEKTGISELELKSWELGYDLPSEEEILRLTDAFGLQSDALSSFIENKE